MKVDNLPMDKFVAANQLKEVRNPIYLNPDKTATEDGIFSYDIFGIPGSKERKLNFGYIDLGCRMMHPFFYISLSQMDRKIQKCIEGSEFYSISKSGELIKDEENGHTGIDWLYKHFKEIKWKKGDSDIRNTKIDVINRTDVNDIFINKWLVIPAFYRDLDFSRIESGHIEVGPENEFYIKLINLANSIKKITEFSNFMACMTTNKMQQCLVDTFRYFIQKPAGKTGYIRKYLISKNFDYSSRSVIATSKMATAETPDEVSVKIGEFGVPLHMLCSDFKPFIIKNVREFFESIMPSNKTVVYFRGEDKEKTVKYERTNINIQFTSETLSDDKISALISSYQRSWEHRWDPLMLIDDNGKGKQYSIFPEVYKGRPFTLTDLLFIATSYAIKKKYIWHTRFPIESMHSTLPSKPVILTTNETEILDFSHDLKDLGVVKNYPKYGCNEWRDATVLDHSKTTIFGADFDGDTMSEIPLFSQEANAESEKLLNSKIAYINVNGQAINTITNEAHLSLYMITKDA